MRKVAVVLSMVVLLLASGIGPVYSGEKDKDEGKKAKLTLKAYPRQGFRPLRISFNATLENVSEQDAEFYCLQEEWDFGDGAVSSEQPNCEQFGSDSKVTIHFFAEHLFDDPGHYTIRFKLGEPIKIRSNQISVLVLDRDTGR